MDVRGVPKATRDHQSNLIEEILNRFAVSRLAKNCLVSVPECALLVANPVPARGVSDPRGVALRKAGSSLDPASFATRSRLLYIPHSTVTRDI